MCGIAGVLSPAPLPEGVLHSMVDHLRHRGPDSEGYCLSLPFQAGVRRLSINDVHGGNQPLSNEDGSIQLLYNGEIYNSPQLRKELIARGHRFHTHCDGEVICHLVEDYGVAGLERLDGMFAIALWNKVTQTLILARDLAGEKPLFFCNFPDNGLAFASETGALLHHPQVPDQLDLQALWDMPTFLWIPEPDTAYKHIKALPRGHALVVTPQGRQLHTLVNRFAPLLADDVVTQVREEVSAAVHSRLLSDVPIGAFLSGGLDSSTVCTLAAKEISRLHTYTIAFEDVHMPFDGPANEAPQAEALAKKLGTRHRTIHFTSEYFLKSLTLFCQRADQPFAVSSGLGVMAVAAAASEDGVKVLLTGDGADEAFGGYPYYACLLGSDVQNNNVESYQAGSLTQSEWAQAIRALPRNLQGWAWHYHASEIDKKKLFDQDRFSGVSSSIRHFDGLKETDTARAFVQQDRDFYFPFEMLRKADRMTMVHGVEGRVPFAAPAVQGLAAQLQLSHMIKGKTLKWVLREAFKGIVDKAVIERRKHGFSVPIDHWLKGPMVPLLEQTFERGSALDRHDLLNSGAMDHALTLCDDSARDNGHSLFSYIMLNMWLENQPRLSL